MEVLSVRLKNFRNYEDEEFEFQLGTNFICGKNAQGKTNLLEAIFLQSGGKSFRQGKERDFILFGKEKAEIQMRFLAYGEENSLKMLVYPDKRKEIYYNGIEIKKNAELSTKFCVVLFAPEHLNLVKEGPDERRKFLDGAISQLKPKYQNVLADYNKVVSQKNFLLKKRETVNQEYLDVWNERLVKLGSYLIFMRGSYVKNLSEKAAVHHLLLSRGKEELQLTYSFFDETVENNTQMEEIQKKLWSDLRESQAMEKENGYCLVGPHRDDIEIQINGKGARIFASQGQQRSVVLSMKLGECEIVKESIGEYPVLLLDDFMSELDKSRQWYVKKNLAEKQVLITTCIPIRGKTMEIREGRLVK